jgi:biopolymer transport protein ExbB
MIVAGGPIMVPLVLCSVVSLAYVVERALRLRAERLAPARLGQEVRDVLIHHGRQAAHELCRSRSSALARVLGAGLRRGEHERDEIERAVEDAGSREVRDLTTSLRPLVVIVLIAPLLGLAGTVFGMIVSFREIALAGGMGRPEQLAAGIGQALITTAAGLVIAIPTQAAYFWLRARIDRFVRRSEAAWDELEPALGSLAAQPVAPLAAPGVAGGSA